MYHLANLLLWENVPVKILLKLNELNEFGNCASWSTLEIFCEFESWQIAIKTLWQFHELNDVEIEWNKLIWKLRELILWKVGETHK